MGSNLQVHDVVVAEVQTGALCALCLNPKNPLAGKFHVGASPAREWKEQSHAGRAPTIEESSIGQSGLNGPTDQLRLFSTKFKHRLKRC